MKILFEGATYKTESLKGVLSDRFYAPLNSTESKVEHAGYYYEHNTENADAIVILPKVFINEDNKAFDKYRPKDILECGADIKAQLRQAGHDKILYNISTWIYQAIKCYKSRQAETTIAHSETSTNIISNCGENDNTHLDTILALLRFYKENQSLFTYIAKVNSAGRKINWSKTVAKKTPFLNGSTPIYFDVVAKKKCINFDEELIILFYSTLNYISSEYGFDVKLSQNYPLIKKTQFSRLLEGHGTVKLRAIKNKYFNDKLVALWKLLYAFFDRCESSERSNKKNEEFLLVKDFNNVFEDMIDDLIGDKKSDIHSFLKDQYDGKRVDHLYKDKSLILDDDIYFVGDSKYYKVGSDVGKKSIEKQYTYAKNVIQYNFDLFYNRIKGKKIDDGIRYRDDLTEGYNITPNFFISAVLDKDYRFDVDSLEKEQSEGDNKSTKIKYQFENRLFDRDTLLLQKYNINFLYVLSAYVSRGSVTKATFKTKARKTFRDNMIEYFNTNYAFAEITPRSDIEEFVQRYFKQLNGKIYRPSNMSDSFIIALELDENSKNSNTEVAKKFIGNFCEVDTTCNVDEYKLK